MELSWEEGIMVDNEWNTMSKYNTKHVVSAARLLKNLNFRCEIAHAREFVLPGIRYNNTQHNSWIYFIIKSLTLTTNQIINHHFPMTYRTEKINSGV